MRMRMQKANCEAFPALRVVEIDEVNRCQAMIPTDTSVVIGIVVAVLV